LKLVRSEKEMSSLCANWREKGFKIGFVPTMGALHAGHLKLVEMALGVSRRVVVSIFVNPTQFGKEEDLDKYPRNLERDFSMLEELGVSAVFVPEPDTVYPPGFSSEIRVNGLTEGLCGGYRRGHFNGVTTVCAVLFGIVKPHFAVFGRKDAQQLAVVKRMVKDLRLGVQVLEAPVVREKDGLAMSSRNAYLSQDERRQAASISRGLREAAALHGMGERDCSVLKKAFLAVIEKEPLLSVQYIEAVNPDTMKSVEVIQGRVLLAAAVFAGKTRLIDNVLIEPEV